MRFHVLGIPHTISTMEYSACAFTTKTVKLCKLLKHLGHHVIHYGHEDSVVACDESVAVTKRYDLDKSYKDHDWKLNGFPAFDINKDWCYSAFNLRAVEEIKRRKEPGDFLLCTFGAGHYAVASEFPDMIIVEPGIGYPGGSFARFRVFESYAILHAYRGLAAVERAGNDHWYDAVIPNFFDGAEFPNNMPDWGPPWSDSDLLLYGNYLMFCGRVNTGKGIHVAEQIAAETKRVLVVAGQGDFEFTKGAKIEQVGVISPADRAQLMGGAMATLCPSTFLEPFCGVQIESMLCGTPVISSDWGAFAEYNIHGKTGYRCRTFEQFLFAVEQAPALNPDECRTHGERFLIENVAPLYDEYFWSVNQVFAGTGGWYAPKVRKDLRNITWNGEYVGA